MRALYCHGRIRPSELCADWNCNSEEEQHYRVLLRQSFRLTCRQRSIKSTAAQNKAQTRSPTELSAFGAQDLTNLSTKAYKHNVMRLKSREMQVDHRC